MFPFVTPKKKCTATESKMQDRIDILMMLAPGLPLLGAILTAVLGPKLLRSQSHWPVIVGTIGALICSLLLLLHVADAQQAADLESPAGAAPYEHVVKLWTWMDIQNAYELGGTSHNFTIDIVLRLDALTAIMLCMVTLISSLVAIYSAGYMHGDRGYWRFFSYIGLFVFSMTMLVSASNFILLFVFWEAVGLCSYLLIGYWYEKPIAAAAGKKAFLVTRIGDFGFMLGLFLIWTTYGSLNYHDVYSDGAFSASTAAADATIAAQGVLSPSRIVENNYVLGGTALAICLLLMLGACGKSAQFPLHVWLPDAMEGPSPVSALIHAATMVTAGVYMVARCTPLYMASPTAQLVVAAIGAFTALLAGLIALTQFDLKRILAYSTISQLGYMFLGLGAGTLAGISAGMFHLFTHAFFKALLFLSAGSVMHAMGNVIDIRRFGGLRKLLPITYATFLVGCLALSGLPPFSGFWSKDAAIASIHDRVHALEHELEHRQAANQDEAHVPGSAAAALPAPLAALSVAQLSTYANVYQWLYYSAMFTAFLTAFYTFRAFLMTFHGELRVPHEAGDHAHEAPPSMYVPLVILAIFAAFAGLVLALSHSFDNFLLHAPSLALGWVTLTELPGKFHASVAAISILLALAGTIAACYLYLYERDQVSFLKRFFNFEWLNQVTEGAFVRLLKNWGPVAAIHNGAKRIGLGWLTALVGDIFLLLVLILSIPLLIGSYLSPYRLSFRKFYFDEIYNLLIVRPLRGIAQLFYWLDRNAVDGLVNACGYIPTRFGNLMRSLQMGLMPFYALAMVLGMIVLLAARMLWAN